MLQDFPETWIAPGHRKGLTWWIPKNISVWANICHAHSFFRAQRYNYPFSCIPQCQGKEFFLPFKFVHINKVSCLRKTKYVFYFTRYGGMHLKPRTWEERIADFIVSKISMLDIVNFRPSRNTQWNSVLKTQVSSLKKKILRGHSNQGSGYTNYRLLHPCPFLQIQSPSLIPSLQQRAHSRPLCLPASIYSGSLRFFSSKIPSPTYCFISVPNSNRPSWWNLKPLQPGKQVT